MSKHTTLDQLKVLAQRTKTEIDAVESKSLVGIKVNGTALAIAPAPPTAPCPSMAPTWR